LPRPTHILVFRFSALGDVAMTVPVVKLLLDQNPGLQISFVSDPFMKPLFDGIERLQFYGADTKKDFNGLTGLRRLAKQIKKDIPFDAIADLHNVVRTKVLRFFLSGKRASIDKGRAEKKELTRARNKRLRPLQSTFQRYADVFAQLGFPVELDVKRGIVRRPRPQRLLVPGQTQSDWLIGVAPFARHLPKMYPLEKMKEVVKKLASHSPMTVVLFGSKEEAAVLDDWAKEIPNVSSVAGKFSFAEELEIIATLDLMISMDSANMHLASMFGVPVVSIWGGTHPYLGFYGWGQQYDNAIQQDLPCRPSSVFGNKPCPVHGEQGCMEGVTVARVYDRVKSNLAI
jgi:ADP-heptose:LPS heptosyltransferase